MDEIKNDYGADWWCYCNRCYPPYDHRHDPDTQCADDAREAMRKRLARERRAASRS